MSMRRYLLHIGYCGSMLRGVQKQREEHEALFVSVGGLVEKGLKRLRPESIEQLYFSSRTDTGKYLLVLLLPPFDAERLESVCRLLEGVHDFASFANVQSKGSIPRETLREIKSITVTPGQPLLDPTLDPLYSQLQFWDVTVHGKSFLYRQVRRTVGVLVGVAQGRLNLEDVQHLLDHPSQRNWNSKATVAPPDGLFLLDVEYPPHVFAEEGDDSGQSPQE
ncbi:tRNA pseudouridine synthase-like 1 [Portunus trituberculatus]|uniref:tRNA pseudouridine synthase n=1 Tax=Portunus trituberculatus TaxID=210409 RepID=A0A5B7DJU5_PORTR|nr:tRNA pseudouridine synthase-like 1 [Portunus trituberculatus]